MHQAVENVSPYVSRWRYLALVGFGPLRWSAGMLGKTKGGKPAQKTVRFTDVHNHRLQDDILTSQA